MEMKVRRNFSPEQKYEMVKDIQSQPTIQAGLEKYGLQHSVYRRWKRQLEVGIQSSLRNGRPRKNPDVRRLEAENRRLKEALLQQSLILSDIKKEMNLD